MHPLQSADIAREEEPLRQRMGELAQQVNPGDVHENVTADAEKVARAELARLHASGYAISGLTFETLVRILYLNIPRGIRAVRFSLHEQHDARIIQKESDLAIDASNVVVQLMESRGGYVPAGAFPSDTAVHETWKTFLENVRLPDTGQNPDYYLRHLKETRIKLDDLLRSQLALRIARYKDFMPAEPLSAVSLPDQEKVAPTAQKKKGFTVPPARGRSKAKIIKVLEASASGYVPPKIVHRTSGEAEEETGGMSMAQIPRMDIAS